jgi:AraC family transcriptional regulator of adaptative response / DNA-3-methyladenine glycosylase II
LLRLTLACRPPLAWRDLLRFLRRGAMPGVERIGRRSYARTVRLPGGAGCVRVQDALTRAHVQVRISPSLLPALMPLLARLRRLFDLDAEPSAVDAHLEAGGLALHVRACPGLRVPGAFDGFEVVTMALLLGSSPARGAAHEVARRVVRALGDPLDADDPSLDRLAPTAERVADAGAPVLEEL